MFALTLRRLRHVLYRVLHLGVIELAGDSAQDRIVRDAEHKRIDALHRRDLVRSFDGALILELD